MPNPVLSGAEPQSFAGGPDGVLVVHGFTGCPASMRDLAKACAAAGYAVELPLLPGHGTAVDDMIATRWAHWSAAAEAAYSELAGRCRRVAVVGLSMGGTLVTWLAANHPEIAAVVVVNPLIEPAEASLRDLLGTMLAEGTDTIAAIASDIARPGVAELAYPATPIAALISLFEAVHALSLELGAIRCPVLIFTSTNDHVVAPSSSDVLAAGVSGPVERVVLDRSYHVATQDHDAAVIETQTVDFLHKVLAPSLTG